MPQCPPSRRSSSRTSASSAVHVIGSIRTCGCLFGVRDRPQAGIRAGSLGAARTATGSRSQPTALTQTALTQSATTRARTLLFHQISTYLRENSKLEPLHFSANAPTPPITHLPEILSSTWRAPFIQSTKGATTSIHRHALPKLVHAALSYAPSHAKTRHPSVHAGGSSGVLSPAQGHAGRHF